MENQKCKGCDENRTIENKHFKLCRDCNNERLAAKKGEKLPKSTLFNFTAPHKAKKKKEKRNKYIVAGAARAGKSYAMDLMTYAEVFKRSDHKCEECGCQLNEEFQDENNRLIAAHRYSHIVPKSIAPEHRYNPEMFNNLCLKDHTEWEHGDKPAMKIFKKNQERWPQYMDFFLSKRKLK